MDMRFAIYELRERGFIDYLNLADSAIKRHEEELSKVIEECEMDEPGLDNCWIADEIESLALYEDLFFESFILWLYGYFEKQMNEFCNGYRICHGLEVQLSDIRGKGIKRASHYLKICKLQLPKPNIWEKLIRLQDIRDSIIHNGGIIVTDIKRQKALKEFINKEDQKIITLSSNGKINLSKLFCEKTIKLVFDYLKEIEGLKKS